MAINIGNHSMLIVDPLGKLPKIIKHLCIGRMEQMWPVFVDQNTGIIKMIITISSDMFSFFNEQHLFTNSCKLAGKDCPGKTSADDYTIKHVFTLP